MFLGILINFNQYYIFPWKVFPFFFIILEHYINLPLLRQNWCYLTWRPVLKRVLLKIIWYPISPFPLQTIATYQDTHSFHLFFGDLSTWNIEVFTLPLTKRELFFAIPALGSNKRKPCKHRLHLSNEIRVSTCLYSLIDE